MHCRRQLRPAAALPAAELAEAAAAAQLWAASAPAAPPHAAALLQDAAPGLDHLLQQLLHLADAAAAALPAPGDAAAGAAGAAAGTAGKAQDNGWLTPLVEALETVLKYFQVKQRYTHRRYTQAVHEFWVAQGKRGGASGGAHGLAAQADCPPIPSQGSLGAMPV